MEPVRTEEKTVGGYRRQVTIYRKQCDCGREFEGPARQKHCTHRCAARVWIRNKRASERAQETKEQ